jgi:hypothetical protein
VIEGVEQRVKGYLGTIERLSEEVNVWLDRHGIGTDNQAIASPI